MSFSFSLFPISQQLHRVIACSVLCPLNSDKIVLELPLNLFLNYFLNETKNPKGNPKFPSNNEPILSSSKRCGCRWGVSILTFMCCKETSRVRAFGSRDVGSSLGDERGTLSNEFIGLLRRPHQITHPFHHGGYSLKAPF